MGLFDGSGDNGMGLMGMYANPQMAGLLGMSQGLLSAAGPSRIPVSMGQAMGAGLGGLQQGYGNALQNQRTMAALGALQDNGMGNGGQPAGPTAQSLPPVSGGANVAGLSGPSAGMGGFAPPTPVSMNSASAQPQSPFEASFGMTPQQMYRKGNAYAMLGLPNGTKMMELAAQYNPALAMGMPTDSMKTAAGAYGYGTPEYTSALQNEVRKNGALAIRPGGGALIGNQFVMTPGQAPAGYMNVQDPTSQSGWATVPVQGGTQAVKSSAAAGSIGKSYGNVTSGFDENGQPTFVNTGALADQTSGGTAPFGGSNGRYPGANQGGGAAPAGNVRPALSPAESEAQKTMGDKSASQYAAEQQSAGGYGTRMFNLNKALVGLQNSDTGPGSDTVNTAKSFLLAHGPQALQSLGIVDPNKIQSYDEANKYLIQYAMNQAGALGEGTDSKLATTLSGNANTHISNLAAQDVVKANMALERMNQASVNSFAATGQSPAKYSTWKSQFASRVDPRVFAWDMMDKDKQQTMYNSMNDAQRNQFRSQYNWATQNGFLGQ